jgi:preprotein translocase subunit SecD
VAEPIIQQQGLERIVVQLPGVQDTARAKEILGAVATLEFRMVDEKNDPNTVQSDVHHWRATLLINARSCASNIFTGSNYSIF